MTILATPVHNSYSHISYLVCCPETGEAAAIDPYHVELTLETARSNQLRITRIINTHEHWDHAGRNEQLREVIGAKVLVPTAAAGVVEKFDLLLQDGDVVEFGSVRMEVIDTPGHTMTHISLLGEDEGEPFLLCGDTIFGAGVGNCGYGGHAPTLFRTVDKLRSRLPTKTRFYPGHDYVARNLEFTLRHEPGNRAAADMLEPARQKPIFTTLEDELQINLFLRLESPELLEILAADGSISRGSSREEVFLALRRLRDSW